jgi:hypothetical protein
MDERDRDTLLRMAFGAPDMFRSGCFGGTIGPMLEALKRLNGGTIHLPGRMKDRPDRDRLAIRFERFKAVA